MPDLDDAPCPLPENPRSGTDEDHARDLAHVAGWTLRFWLEVLPALPRADAGRRLNPGMPEMDVQIGVLSGGIVYAPRAERARFYVPVRHGLAAVAARWTDAASAAMGALAHVTELQRLFSLEVDAAAAPGELERHRAAVERAAGCLRSELTRLSCALLNAPAAPRTRKDKGRKHERRGRGPEGWRTAGQVADDFGAGGICLEPGVWYGGCSEAKINRWDQLYPDEDHAQPACGYHRRLRIDPDLKGQYWNALAAWKDFLTDYRRQFTDWRRTHPHSPRGDFRFTKMKRSDIDPGRIGRKAGGGLAIEARRA